MSATQTDAPSFENRIAASRPIPEPAPVITTTLPSRRPTELTVRGDVDVLDLGVALERVHPELAAEPRLLEPAERRRHANGCIRVDGEDAGFDRPRHPHGPSDVPGPDRPREPERRVIGDAHRVVLVFERNQGGDRPEHLLTRDSILVRRLDERAREPEAASDRGVATKDNGTIGVRRHLLPV